VKFLQFHFKPPLKKWTSLGFVVLSFGSSALAVDLTALQSAFVFQLPKYFEWPTAPKEQVLVCVSGDAPFGDTLKALSIGKSLNGIPYKVETTNGDVATLKKCQIVVVGSENHSASAGSGLKDLPILTVKLAGGKESGEAMLHFFLEGEKLRFSVSEKWLQSSGLKAGAQIMKLAKRVE
jgi:hypothetical protein